MQNDFFYLVTDAGGTAEACYEAFIEDAAIMEAINAIQTDHVQNDFIRVLNLFSLTDFYEASVEGTGEYAVNTMPADDAINFTLKLNTRGVRPGHKRFSGLPVTYGNVGLVTDATYITKLNTLRTALHAPIGVDLTPMFTPVVVKRIVVPATEDHGKYYRLPNTVEELNYGTVVSVLIDVNMGGQDSRSE